MAMKVLGCVCLCADPCSRCCVCKHVGMLSMVSICMTCYISVYTASILCLWRVFSAGVPDFDE